MVGRGGLFARISFMIILAAFIYISCYVILESLMSEDGSILGAIVVLSFLWWVYASVVGIFKFVFISTDEIPYEKFKDNMRNQGYKVIEDDMPLPTQVSGRSGREAPSTNESTSRSTSNSEWRSTSNPQVRMRIGAEGQNEDELLRDIVDMFRST